MPIVELHEWLSGKADAAGFLVDEDSTIVQPGHVYVNKTGDGKGQNLFAVRYDGFLTVNDPARFRQALIHGIGPAKAYGFGMLSVAPAEER